MTKQATAVFAASNGSDCIQLLINRSWRKNLLTSCLTWPVICMSASSSMPRSRTVPVGGTRTPQTSSIIVKLGEGKRMHVIVCKKHVNFTKSGSKFQKVGGKNTFLEIGECSVLAKTREIRNVGY